MSFNTFVEQQFAMEPQDQVAVVGARVILPCRVINKQGVLQWTKDDFGLGTRRKLVGFDRYSMIGKFNLFSCTCSVNVSIFHLLQFLLDYCFSTV